MVSDVDRLFNLFQLDWCQEMCMGHSCPNKSKSLLNPEMVCFPFEERNGKKTLEPNQHKARRNQRCFDLYVMPSNYLHKRHHKRSVNAKFIAWLNKIEYINNLQQAKEEISA